jgi:hypothetical protein
VNTSAVLAAPTLQNPAAQLAYTPPELIVASRDVLLQGLSLLFKLSDSTFSQFVEPYDASIGTHYSQVVRHFERVIRSVRSGEVNYDTREAHPRLGTEVTYAAIATCDVLRAIKNYDNATLRRSCRVLGTSPDIAQPPFVDTNVGRELAYCISHAQQRYATIRLICGHIGVDAPAEFRAARAGV